MKKMLIIPLMMLSIGIVSCKKEVNPVVNSADQQIAAMLDKPGYNPLVIPFRKCDNWTVTNFSLNGMNYTNDFTGCRLNFCPDNTVVFYNDIYAVHGNWYYRWIDAGGNKMVIYFDMPERLPGNLWNNLAGEWNVAKVRNNYLRFEINRDLKVLEINRVLPKDE